MSSRFPFPAHPNGWFRVPYSHELAPGEVRSLHFFGRDLVLFRAETGSARLFDAHCPHLGAHLGRGGHVEGDAIRCPFHAWRWNGEGVCDHIPYAKRIPPGARIRAWSVLERNGIVWVHHDRDGRCPTFPTPEPPQLSDPAWTPLEIRRWTIRSRWLDMNENAVDRAASDRHRRDADDEHLDADRRGDHRHELRLHREGRRRRGHGARRRGRDHPRPREADESGHPDLGAREVLGAAAPVRRRRELRPLPALDASVLPRRGGSGGGTSGERAIDFRVELVTPPAAR